MANPIIRPGTVFASYMDFYKVSLPDVYHAHSVAMPQAYTKPVKNVHNPVSSYHDWLKSSGGKVDAVEQRKYILKAITDASKKTGDTQSGTQNVLTRVHDDQVHNNPDHPDYTAMPLSDQVPSKSKTKSASKAKSVKKTTSKSVKKTKPKRALNRKNDTLDSDDENENAFSEEEASAGEEEASYTFEESTIQNTVLPNEQQMATYKRPIAVPMATTLTEEKSSVQASTAPATNDQVFDAMTSLGWRDKDEGLMNITSLNRISSSNVIGIFTTMKKLADELFLAIHEKTGALDDAEPEDKYNFLFHVIAKGEAMYFQTIADPEFCLYMLDQYQPLYTYMKKKLKIRE